MFGANKMKDKLGDRMKMYEKMDTQRFLPLVPVCARIDGRGFSKYTKGLDRPFDIRFTRVMQLVTRLLVEKTNAIVGYTQSDEITLVWYSDSVFSQIFFDGKKQKMISVLSSMATAYFNREWSRIGLPWRDDPATFDCRVWNVPNKVEAVNVLLWRELDAIKNSVSMATRSKYSSNQMHGKHVDDMKKMLMDVGIDWNQYPEFFKRGTYYRRVNSVRKFTTGEIENLPQKHQARFDPYLTVERSDVVEMGLMPNMIDIGNRVGFIFDGRDPITKG